MVLTVILKWYSMKWWCLIFLTVVVINLWRLLRCNANSQYCLFYNAMAYKYKPAGLVDCINISWPTCWPSACAAGCPVIGWQNCSDFPCDEHYDADVTISDDTRAFGHMEYLWWPDYIVTYWWPLMPLWYRRAVFCGDFWEFCGFIRCITVVMQFGIFLHCRYISDVVIWPM